MDITVGMVPETFVTKNVSMNFGSILNGYGAVGFSF
jgi:hypothetical protein